VIATGSFVIKNPQFKMRIILLIIILAFASCKYLPPIGEKYQKPDTKMPNHWDSVKKGDKYLFGKIEQNWWKNFHDPILNQLIELAVKNNYDFKIVQSQVLEARANLISATSDLAPKISASGSASRKNNYISPLAPNNHMLFNLFTAGFDATWELDLFGANYRLRQSAKASFEAYKEAANYALVSLIAEIVRNYSDLRAAQNQMFLQQKIKVSYEEILQLNEAKESAGLLSNISVGPIKIMALNARSDLADSEAKLTVALYNLEFLSGKRPGEMKNFLGEIREVPVLQKALMADAPISLLRNRPDIRQAERELASATELQGYALAQIFPKISLSGFFGFYNTKSGNLLKPSSQVFSSGANLSMPVLNFGGVIAGIKTADERKKQALVTYEKKVNQALLDVESALINFVKEDEKLTLNFKTNKINKMLTDLSLKKQNQGMISYLDYLQSKIELLQSEQKLNSARHDFTEKTIALYKALGGGWEVFYPE
jgi:NodT family efflux transporter outer membrane factor (OMF) lipoprotein